MEESASVRKGFLEMAEEGFNWCWLSGSRLWGLGIFIFYCMICVTKICMKNRGALRR